MRLLVNIRDGSIVLDGKARLVELPVTRKLLLVSWDGEVGIMVPVKGDPIYFDDEAELEPYLSAWANAPPPQPPPLPPWWDADKEALPLPENPIPMPVPDMTPFEIPLEDQATGAWDDPPPEGFVPLVGPWAATEEEWVEEMARLEAKKDEEDDGA